MAGTRCRNGGSGRMARRLLIMGDSKQIEETIRRIAEELDMRADTPRRVMGVA